MNALENFFEERLTTVSTIFRPERVFLGFLACLGITIIILFNSQVLPLHSSYAIFYFFLMVLLGLYRPAFLWQGIVFFLPFEIVILASLGESGDIRTYQFGMLALLIASSILWFQKKITLPPVRWFDGALMLVILGAILAFVVRDLPLPEAKEILILASFGALYCLGRLMTRNKEDLKIFLVTLETSGLVVLGYALYQSLAFKYYLVHFMVMPGRPNSVFEEADWLGFFLGLVAIISLVRFIRTKQWARALFHAAITFLFLSGLILTVSRSAWLGFAGGAGVIIGILGIQYFSGFFGTRKSETRPEYHAFLKAFLGAPFIALLAFGSISFLGLTRFDLDQRFTSAGTGEQIITIACQGNGEAPSKITDVAELANYGCQHINLEEQKWYEENGFHISTTARPDPNIEIRRSLYDQSFSLLKEHFLFGLGWGESLKIFGNDSRGAGLNSSNVFIEIWLGSGIMGFVAFLLFWLGFLSTAIIRLQRRREMTEGFWITLLVVALWIHASIFNFFNAGLLLGTFIALLILFAWYLEKTGPHLRTLWRK